MHQPAALLEAALLINKLQLKPGNTVGDFGCGGSGHIALAISQAIGPDGGVLVFDVQKSALSATMSLAQTRGANNIKSVWTDLETYQGASGVSDASLDSGILINVLHQSKHPKAILTEVGRMLKPGARLLIVDWLTETASQLAPPPEQRLGIDHIVQVAEGVGYSVFEKFSPSAYHWGLVLIKK